jgi:hypothetical protein
MEFSKFSVSFQHQPLNEWVNFQIRPVIMAKIIVIVINEDYKQSQSYIIITYLFVDLNYKLTNIFFLKVKITWITALIIMNLTRIVNLVLFYFSGKDYTRHQIAVIKLPDRYEYFFRNPFLCCQECNTFIMIYL